MGDNTQRRRLEGRPAFILKLSNSTTLKLGLYNSSQVPINSSVVLVLTQFLIISAARAPLLAQICLHTRLSCICASVRSSNRQIVKSSNHQIVKSSNRQIVKSSNHQIIKSSNHQIIKSSNHQIRLRLTRSRMV